MVNGWHTQQPASFEGLALKGKNYLKSFYAHQRMESPMGGTLHELRVRPKPDGSGAVLLECSESSLRYELRIPKATRRDREKVREQQKEGRDPLCPRHVDPPVKLQRSGDHLVCPRCQVRYGRPV
jgi:hypothetical protein